MISSIGGSGGRPDFSRIQAQMQQKSAQAFSKADGDGSGSLNVDEFRSMVKNSPMAKMGGSAQTDKASEVFGKLDADGDGALTQTELKGGMSKLQEKMSTQMFARMNPGRGESGTGQGAPDVLKQLGALLQALSQDGPGRAASSLQASISLSA
ncbi:Ca2+-binding EF-hand superfamily protein [Inhella inkyongensis]|uniref:Ca2+-binding EF-hand superfamily protein n=1 Tax=Inhella inkyongensis TaxID=392593 RepID=A0A840S633_9BURK|nr:EF-hand domain-containing protein [Inhella inkyongensis]MBB5205042.1 Ca2+-binding EF-hand superfamily protein [Inhella inkyongensis]